MRQWKIALSLAVVGALAAPFVFRTYKIRPPSVQTWVPMSEEVKAGVIAYMKRTNGCQNFVDQANSPALDSCRFEQKALDDGGSYGSRPSIPLYLTLNAAVALITFGIIFGLTFLVPALAIRYWRWLKA
jgi:hypothetical protein